MPDVAMKASGARRYTHTQNHDLEQQCPLNKHVCLILKLKALEVDLSSERNEASKNCVRKVKEQQVQHEHTLKFPK